MSKGKKVTVGIVSWVVILLVLAAVWYLNANIVCDRLNVLNKAPVSDMVIAVVNTVLFALVALLTEGISNTITGMKESFVEKTVYVAMIFLLVLGFFKYPIEGILTLNAFMVLFPLVTFLIIVWTYMREIPYDCFGSKEPLFAVGLWIIVLGLLTGFFSVALGITVFVFGIMATAYVKKVGHVVQPWMIVGIIAPVLGVAAGFLVPAFLKKNLGGIFDSYLVLDRYPEFGFFALDVILKDLVCPIAILVLLSIVIKGVYGSFVGRETTFVFIMAAVALASQIFEQTVESKSLQVTTINSVVLLILAMVVISKKIFEKKASLKKGIVPLTVFVGLVGIYRIISLILL